MTIKNLFSAKALAVSGVLLGVLAAPGFAQGARGGISWSGNVDETTVVTIHGRDVRTQTVRGKSPTNVSSEVGRALPNRPVQLVLRGWDGRGRVRIVQQPSFANNFTAKVRIQDPQSGSSHYDFRLSWQGRGLRPRSF